MIRIIVLAETGCSCVFVCERERERELVVSGEKASLNGGSKGVSAGGGGDRQ